MKVVQTQALINIGDWLVVANDKEKKALFIKVCKVSDISHTGICIEDALGTQYDINAGGEVLTAPRLEHDQEFYTLKDVIRGQAPLYLFVGDDPVFSKATTAITLYIRDSAFKAPARLTTTSSEVSPLGSNYSVQVDSFSRAHFNHAGECSTGINKDVAIVHARMTWN